MARFKKKEWTEEQLSFLKSQYLKKSVHKIAEELGFCYNTVRVKIKEIGIHKRDIVREKHQKTLLIKKTYKELGLVETAKKLNLTKGQVWGILYREKQKRQKAASGVDSQLAEKVRKNALRFAYQYGLSGEAEDFASFCVLRLYEGRRARIRHLAGDYRRSKYGHERSKTIRSLKMSESLNSITIGEWSDTDEGDDSTQKINPVDPSSDLPLFETINSISLNGMMKPCFVLHVFFGLTPNEIANCFDTEESRILQLLTEAKIRLQHSI